QALQRPRRVRPGLGASLAADARVGPLGEHHHVLAGLVVHPAVVGAAHRAAVVAVALAEARAAVRADVLDGHHIAAGAAEEAQLLAEERDLERLAPADRAILDRGIPVVAQTELRDQRTDVAAEPRDAVGRARFGRIERGGGPGRCRHAGLLGRLRA